MELLSHYSQRDDDELREYCLQACEAFVQKCPDKITPHISPIVTLCLVYLTYDPNYNYGAEDGEPGHMMDTEFDEDGDSEEYSDDDDMSWKVRRAAAKCLESVIATRSELIEEFYRTLSPALIARFKEREENVKSDIFHAYIALLKVTRTTAAAADDHDPDMMQQQATGPVAMLQSQVPHIIKAVQPLMREKSVKTRQDCFLLLRELLNALPGAYTSHVDQLMPGINYSLSDKNTTSNMKIDALHFVWCLLQRHSPRVFHAHIQLLVPLVVSAVGDSFYKIVTEALLVLQQMVKVVRPVDGGGGGGGEAATDFDFTAFVPQLYECTLVKLRTPEVDQEVKDRAIACMGQLIANMGDVLRVSGRERNGRKRIIN